VKIRRRQLPPKFWKKNVQLTLYTKLSDFEDEFDNLSMTIDSTISRLSTDPAQAVADDSFDEDIFLPNSDIGNSSCFDGNEFAQDNTVPLLDLDGHLVVIASNLSRFGRHHRFSVFYH
jgi:hypothetical protein